MKEIKKQINSAWSNCIALYSKAAAQLGIGYPEMMVLYALVTEEKLTQKQIAENYGMQKQTVNTVIKALTKHGYVLLTVGEADKREKTISLTDRGQLYAEKIICPLQNTEDKLYKLIGEARLREMAETLELYNLLLAQELNQGLQDE